MNVLYLEAPFFYEIYHGKTNLTVRASTTVKPGEEIALKGARRTLIAKVTIVEEYELEKLPTTIVKMAGFSSLRLLMAYLKRVNQSHKLPKVSVIYFIPNFNDPRSTKHRGLTTGRLPGI